MLSIEHLSCTLGKFCLQDVTFTVNKGDYFVLLGESGAGKTIFPHLSVRSNISYGLNKQSLVKIECLAQQVGATSLLERMPETLSLGEAQRVALARCLAKGLLVLTAGEDTVRLLPPLVITDAEIDEGLSILRSSLDDVAAVSKA